MKKKIIKTKDSVVFKGKQKIDSFPNKTSANVYGKIKVKFIIKTHMEMMIIHPKDNL